MVRQGVKVAAVFAISNDIRVPESVGDMFMSTFQS